MVPLSSVNVDALKGLQQQVAAEAAQCGQRLQVDGMCVHVLDRDAIWSPATLRAFTNGPEGGRLVVVLSKVEQRLDAVCAVPAGSTVNRILVRHGLVVQRKRKAPGTLLCPVVARGADAAVADRHRRWLDAGRRRHRVMCDSRPPAALRLGRPDPSHSVGLESYDQWMEAGRSDQAVHLVTGVDVRYIDQGDPSGVPVLLLHAWGESLGSFDRLIPLLPRTIRALAMDQRGHGDSDKPADGYALAAFAGDVTAFLDAMGLSRAVLVGSSSGGYVAQQVAVSSPERVRGLVLVGAPRSLRGRPAFADEVDRLTDPINRAWVRESLTWFPRFHDVPGWYIEARVDDGVRMPARVWRQALAGLTEATPPTEAGTIDTPTLVIWGGRDGLLPRADSEALAAAIPGSRLVVYPDTGHLVLWEEPARTASDLTAFVAHLP